MDRKTRSLAFAAAILAGVWLLAWAGYAVAQNHKMTAAKLRAFARSISLKHLTGAARAQALRDLAEKSKALMIEDRREWWLSGDWRDLFADMTEEEKGQYMEATEPTALKQVFAAFEQLPSDRRKKALDDIMKRLKEQHQLLADREPGQDGSAYGTNGPPTLSPELENRAVAIGLKTFYTESSAEVKAEMGPVLEEMQRQMQSGRVFH